MRQLLILFLALVPAGCSLDGGGDGGASIEAGELRELVLQPEDVARAFRRFDEGRQVAADAPGGSRSDPNRFGRTGGWKARYQRSGTTTTPGPLVIESRIDAFESGDGAGDELDAARSDLGGGELPWRSAEAPELGEEALAMTYVQPGVGKGVRHYLVVWRRANATASIVVNGFEGRLPLEDVVELAGKQDRRLTEASTT